MATITVNTLLSDNWVRLKLYNNYGFLKNEEVEEVIQSSIINPLLKNQNVSLLKIDVEGHQHYFILTRLDWDSDFFNLDCYRIELILFKHHDILLLRNAIDKFLDSFLKPGCYCTINIPSRDLLLIQAISNTRFILTETRLNYYLKLNEIRINDFNEKNIESAKLNDIPILSDVASRMRNPYDRVHADPFFTDTTADQYIAKFAAESIKGFADLVLKVSDRTGTPFGFLACNNPIWIGKNSISRLVLAAIDSSVEKGRLFDLLLKMISIQIEQNADYLTTITQSANIPAIRTWEKAGFSLFNCTHIYSFAK